MSSSSGVGKEKRGSGATVRACDSCRRRKRKCVWNSGPEGCTPCIQANESCSTTHIRKPRAKSTKRANRIAEYESRIHRLESLLEDRSAAQPQAPQQPLQPPDPSVRLSDVVSSLRDEIETFPLEQGPQIGPEGTAAGWEGFDFEDEWTFSSNSDSGPSQVQTSPEHSFGALSIHENLLEVRNDATITPSVPFQPKMPITHVQPPLTRSRCDGYLPPPELGTSLLSEFLVDFNTAIPLYRPYIIVEHIRNCYMGGSDGTPVAWASTYNVFGIAHRLRAMSAAASPWDNEQADYYLKRNFSNLSNLLLAPPSLELIQCLLGVAYLIQTSHHSTPHASFASTALRLAQCLAYNDDQAQIESPKQDIEQQRRVFWIAFCRDNDESILSNAPATHRRDDISASQPDVNSQDGSGAVTAAEGTWRVNIFSLRARLALLQAEAIEKVLSVKARRNTPAVAYAAARDALQGLQDWRKHELFQLDAEQLLHLLYRSDLVHVLGLEASYFATVFRLQAFLVLGMDTRVNPFSTDALGRLAEQREYSSYSDAKRFLSLLAVAPQGDIGICWTIKLPIVAAFITVLAHSIHNPSAPAPSQPEMQEYSRILHTLTTLAHKSEDVELQKARDLCMMLLSQVEMGRKTRDMQSISAPEFRPFQLEEVVFSRA